MRDALAAALAAPDDHAVCAGVFDLLTAHYPPDIRPADLPIEQRTVFTIWTTNGLIGNGGFNDFFLADSPGDPDYAHMRAAYDAIDCEPASSSLRRVFEAFADGVPSSPKERQRAFVKGNNAAKGALNRDFLRAEKDLVAALAEYIRTHGDSFIGIEKPASGQKSGPRLPVIPGGKADPVAIGAGRLPHWARVAFYARCARSVFPLWEEAWPHAPPERAESVEQAIVLAEMCGTQGKAVGNLKTAATNAIQAGNGEVLGEDDPPPTEPDVILNVANAAAKALEFILDEEEADPYGFAKSAIDAAEREDLMEDLQDDFKRIKQLARDGGWTDKTPVSPEVFDPTYVPPAKSWWKVW